MAMLGLEKEGLSDSVPINGVLSVINSPFALGFGSTKIWEERSERRVTTFCPKAEQEEVTELGINSVCFERERFLI
jgi:hypothetical protein